MADIPRRRWFRFGLRTVFVVMTLVACGLGWQLRLVRERQAVLGEIRQIDLAYRETRRDPKRPSPEVIVTAASLKVDEFLFFPPRETKLQVPYLRQLLGDEPYAQLVVAPSDDPSLPQLFERMENAFPEAELYHGFSFRDSLNKPLAERRPNRGTEFKTGLKDYRDLEQSD